MEQLQRPPTGGPGSGVAAWRAYAAAVTGTPAAEWEAMSREDIVSRLDGAAAETAGGAAAEQAGAEAPQPAPSAPARRRRPEWMVPTADGGRVPERRAR